MKIKDLESTTMLNTIPLIVPKDVYVKSSLPKYGIKQNTPVYLQGFLQGDFFVKTDIDSSQIYPMFWSKVPDDIEEWEVAQNNNEEMK